MSTRPYTRFPYTTLFRTPARLGLRTGSAVGDLLFASRKGSFPTATISMSGADHGQSVRAIPDGRKDALAGSANKNLRRPPHAHFRGDRKSTRLNSRH